jgi:hypothetical protein
MQEILFWQVCAASSYFSFVMNSISLTWYVGRFIPSRGKPCPWCTRLSQTLSERKG